MTRAAMKFQQGMKFAYVTFDYVEQTAPPVGLAAQATAIANDWGSAVSVSQSSDCGLVEVICRSDTGNVGMWSGVIPGQSSLSALPINCAVLVNKRAALTRRGRFYVPGILESQVASDGQIVAGAQAAWQASMASFLQKLDVNDLEMRVKTTGVGGLTVYDVVESLEVQAVIATQRRRMRK